MVAILNNPLDKLSSGGMGPDDEDNEYKRMLIQQLQETDRPVLDQGPSQNQLLASLSSSADKLGTIGGRTARNDDVQRYADLIDKNKSMADQQRMAQLDRKQKLLAELAKLRDTDAQKQTALAYNEKKTKEDREYQENRDKRKFEEAQKLIGMKTQSAKDLLAAKNDPEIKKPTESQNVSSYHASRMIAANKNLDNIMASGYNPASYSAAFRKTSLPIVGQVGASSEDRAFQQAAKEFIASVLRKETGAAVTPQEFQEYSSIYFPAPGDDEQTIAQKADARKRATENMVQLAGNAYKPTENSDQYVYRPPAEDGTAYAATPKGPKVGEVVDGYRFKGGNPKDQASWEEVE